MGVTKEMRKKRIVHTTVHIGTPDDMEGLGIAVDIKAEGLGVNNILLKAAHKVLFGFMVNCRFY